MVRTSFAGRNFCYHHTIKPEKPVKNLLSFLWGALYNTDKTFLR